MMHSPKEMAAWVRARREELGLSLFDVYSVSDVPEAVLSDLERGRCIPAFDRAARLYRSLGYRIMMDGKELSSEAVRERLRKDEVKHLKCVTDNTLYCYRNPDHKMKNGIPYDIVCRIVTELRWKVTIEPIEGFEIVKTGTVAGSKLKVRGKGVRDEAISSDEAEARKIGLSYGMYKEHERSGYLPRYIEQWRAAVERDRREDVRFIESNIIGAGSHGTPRGMMEGVVKI